MQVTVKQCQSLLDIAVQETGSIESLFEFAFQNNISITDELAIGTILENVEPIDKRVLNYYKRNAIVPATGRLEIEEGIEFWYVEHDFIVS